MLSDIVPLLLIFSLGYFLKRVKVFKDKDAHFFLKFVFFVSAPGLILYSFPKIKFEATLFYLPVIAILISLICLLLSSFIFYILKFNKTNKNKTKATFIISTMIMNTSLLVAVAFSLFSANGVVRAQMFDLGNAIMVFSLVYFIASYFNPMNNALDKRKKLFNSLKKLLEAPPLWAMFIGVMLNLFGVSIPKVVDSTFYYLGGSLIPLVMLSLGVYFELKIKKPLLTFTAVFIRIAIGLGLGLFFVFVFKLHAVDKLVVLLGATAPAGYNTLVFSSINNLDEDLAASVVSLTILVDILLIPVLVSIV